MRTSLSLGLLAGTALAGVATSAHAQTSAAPGDAEPASISRDDTIIVTGSALRRPVDEMPTPVIVLSGDELAHRRLGGLGETLAGLPGVHLDNFGAGASRPVIRGQTVPRIEILTDGAELFDVSTVSPDHAITTDPLLLDAIEVLRGPAAAIYGGDAANGAVNLIDSKVPKALPEDGLDGAVETRYGVGDNGFSAAGRATAALGPFAVHIEGARHDADDYEVPDEFGTDTLTDSFAESGVYSVGASWVTGKGYVGAAYSRQDSEYGLPGHAHTNAVCHTHGRDLHCAAHDEFNDPFGSSDSHTAKINLRADRVDVRADYQDLLPGIDGTRVRLSYTDYQHSEIDGPYVFSQYTNEVYDGRVELTHAPLFGFTGTFGAQYTDGTFTGLNINDLHQDPGYEGFYFGTVPPYDHVTENVGVFLSERRAFGSVDVEFAVRQDWREITLPAPGTLVNVPPEFEAEIIPILIAFFGPDWETQLPLELRESYADQHPGAEHEPLSASLGATWNIGDGYSAGLSVAHTERAPNVRELYAYGNNLATNSYELGLSQRTRASSSFPDNTTDVMETTDSINLTFRKTEGPTQFEVGLFHQDVEDYVFARLIETEVETGIPHNYLMYVAADATFTGIDGQVSHQLTPESRVTVFGDYVEADLTSEDDNLPRIPPGRLGVRYDWAQGPMTADIEYVRTFEQDRVASYETETDGYDMVNATLAYRVELDSGRPLDLYMRATNLTNELAFAHTSFVKEQSPLRGRNFVFGVRTRF